MSEWPRVDAYLASLPDGIESHPTCQTKSALIRSALKVRPVEGRSLAGLPPVVAEMLENPPPATQWVGTVPHFTAQLAIGDLHDLQPHDYDEFWYAHMKRLMTGPVYSTFFRLISPSYLVRTSTMRWSQFYRGWHVEVKPVDAGLDLRLRYPTHLLPPEAVQGFRGVWQAMIDVARSSKGRAELLDHDAHGAHYMLRGFKD